MSQILFIMKNYALFAIACIFLLGSCTDVVKTSGSYTYKLSGTATVRDGSTRETVTLNDETGQMDIIQLTKDSVKIIMNQLSGSVVMTNAYVSGKNVVLDPYSRAMKLYTEGEQKDIISAIIDGDDLNTGDYTTYDIEISGSGIRYDNIIIFDLDYYGNERGGSKKIIDSDVHIVAKAN